MRSLGYEVHPHDPKLQRESVQHFISRSQWEPEWFWKACLEDLGIEWMRDYERVLDLNNGPEWAEWFCGGTTNITANCLYKHLNEAADRVALIAETEDRSVRKFTFAEVAEETSRVAAALRSLGIGPGDTVACYLPMVAEVVFAMLGTMQVGAIFIPIFSGYAAPAVRERLVDASVKLLFTADGSMRRGQPFPIKPQADEAAADLDHLQHILVVERVGDAVDVPWTFRA